MAADLVGKTLGDFEVEALVGKGSMARVYQARQLSLRRQVALKVLEEGIFTPGDNIKRFLREAEALARLEHSNIVPVYAAGEQQPYYFFAMRLIRGGTLQDAMRAGITAATALRWSYQICRALAFAHAAGIVHRDLKPTNVLLHDDVALLSDFGLARLRDVSTITQMGYIVGTPLYMSPEQTLGEEVGPASDCFSMGVIMYQMITGRHPFVQTEPKGMSKSERRMRLFQRIQAAQCKPLSEFGLGIPSEIEAVVMRALTQKPADRFADGPAMLKALDDAWCRTPEDSRVVQYDRSIEYDGDEPAPEIASFGSTAAMTDAEPVGEAPVVSGRSGSTGSDVLRVDTEVIRPQADKAEAKTESKKGEGPQYLSILGRYKIIRELGHGGQGVVYHAHDPVLDREVALKVLRSDAMSDRRMIELFWNEARAAARLNHPHIITIYDFGIESDSPYLTMQFIEGPALDQFIAKGRPLPLNFALRVLIQAADAIGFAHEAGVIHLDVKPGNILVRQSRAAGIPLAGIQDDETAFGRPHALLTDFTMAQIRRAAEKQCSPKLDGTLSGTIPYASPEQLEGDWSNVGPHSDIFSLGVVFYEMLTGRRLFAGDQPLVSRQIILSGKTPRPSQFTAGIPESVDELCARMLNRVSSERPKSAAEIIRLGEDILQRLGRG